MLPLSDLSLFSFVGAGGVKQRPCARTLYPAGTRRPADRIAATVRRNTEPEQMQAADREQIAAGDRPERQTYIAPQEYRRSAHNANTAPERCTWYMIPDTAPERVQSHGSGRRCSAGISRRISCRTGYRINTTDFSSCDNMTVRRHKKTLQIYGYCDIMSATKGKSPRHAKRRRSGMIGKAHGLNGTNRRRSTVQRGTG